jgi:hypothetical protein
MGSFKYRIIYTLFLLFLLEGTGLCLDGKSLLALRNAGIKEETILIIMKEKVIETCAFTVEEIVAFKDSGMKDSTIQSIIKEGSFMKDSDPIIYGEKIRSLRQISPSDLISLKNAGIDDETIRQIASGSFENLRNRDQVFDLLKDMGIIIDKRE